MKLYGNDAEKEPSRFGKVVKTPSLRFLILIVVIPNFY